MGKQHGVARDLQEKSAFRDRGGGDEAGALGEAGGDGEGAGVPAAEAVGLAPGLEGGDVVVGGVGGSRGRGGEGCLLYTSPSPRD